MSKSYYKIQDHWSKELKRRHRLANWRFESYRPTEPNRDYYLFGDYQLPKANCGSKAREMMLRRKAYKKAQADYERDGYWKDEVTITQKQRIANFWARVRYVREHPEDLIESNKLKYELIEFGILAAVAFGFLAFSIYASIASLLEASRACQP